MCEIWNEGSIDEEDFQIQVFHAISHLNRLWNGRNHSGEIDYELHVELSNTPPDFRPLG